MADAPSLADERTVDTPFIFVYGSLMRGFDLHHYMAGATFIGVGWTQGALVVVGGYPGLLERDGTVAGEIYRLEEVAATLDALDDLEGFDPGNPDKSEYVRRVRAVHTQDGPIVKAWVYVYNRDAAAAPALAGGDWRRYVR